MRVKAAMLAALLGLGVGSLDAGSAQAQFHWDGDSRYYEGLPRRVIVRAVRSRGLVPVSRIMRRGNVYYVNGADARGRVHRVMVDAYSGRVVRIDAAAPSQRARRLPPLTRSRPRDDYARGDHADSRLPPRERVGSLPPLRPRASIPRSAPRTAAVSPTRPPTPRPRPASPDETATATPTEPAPSTTQAAAPATPAETTARAPDDGAQKPKPLPRVVLPGGPLPKAERATETRPGRRVAEDTNAASGETITGSTSAPPAAAKAEPPAAKPAPSGMPPMQSFD